MLERNTRITVDGTCAECGGPLEAQAYVDERVDLWCPACRAIRGVVRNPGGNAVVRAPRPDRPTPSS